MLLVVSNSEHKSVYEVAEGSVSIEISLEALIPPSPEWQLLDVRLG